MQSTTSRSTQTLVQSVAAIVSSNQYKKVVLQLPKDMLCLAFDIVAGLKKTCTQTQFFVLYDSLKQSCCLDLLGAQHLGYDGFVHFGRACFSSPHQRNHHYILQQPQPARLQQIKVLVSNPSLEQQFQKHNIGYLLLDQAYYQPIKKFIQNNKILTKNVQILRLTHDAQQGQQYLIFGYHLSQKQQNNRNLFIISQIEDPSYSAEMNIYEKISFSLKKLRSKIGQQLFYLGDTESKLVAQYRVSNNKRLMQRYSMASQLQNHDVFGIIISNTATSFFQTSLQRTLSILKKHNKKVYVFMMNNLNQVKLGNFPEIEVYVIISCFNHSLFSIKDFHRLVVTPADLQIAFQNTNFQEYLFDQKVDQRIVQQKQAVEENKLEQQATNLQLEAVGSESIMLQNKIQTLDYYRSRQYKGLIFQQKKQIKKMGKGKVGLAEQYKPLQ